MIVDEPHEVVVHERRTVFEGHVWDVRTDELTLESHRFERDYIVHPGAVGIVAIDAELNMLLVHQYRHAHGTVMWEAPAGLLDEVGEDPLEAAKRELLEETGFTAGSWNVLLDLATTPGGSSEVIRMYLAQGLVAAPEGRPIATDEEAHMSVAWHPVTQVLAAINAGHVTNAALVAGTLALLTALAEPGGLRPGDAPWPARDRLVATGRIRPNH